MMKNISEMSMNLVKTTSLYTLISLSLTSCAINTYQAAAPKVATVQKLSEGWYQARINFKVLSGLNLMCMSGHIIPKREGGVMFFAFHYQPDQSKVVSIPCVEVFRDGRSDDGIVFSRTGQGQESDATFFGKDMDQALVDRNNKILKGMNFATWYNHYPNNQKCIEIDLKNRTMRIQMDSKTDEYQVLRMEGDL
jgi:hypothetical protein